MSQPDGDGCARLEEVLPALREAALGCEREEIIELLRRIVPSYSPTAPTAPVAAQPRPAPVVGGHRPAPGRPG